MGTNKLKLRRQRFDLTQTELAEKTGTSQNQISQIERGVKPTKWLAKKIADVLKTDPKTLFKEISK